MVYRRGIYTRKSCEVDLIDDELSEFNMERSETHD